MAASVEILLRDGLVHHLAGRLDEAERKYAQVRQRAPRLFDGQHLSGLLAYQKKHYTEARRMLEQAVRLDPRSAIASLRLGLACAGTGDLPAALRALQAAVALDPKLPGGWLALALAWRDAGRLDEAVAAAERAALVELDSASVLENCGALVAARRGLAAALPYLERATRLGPERATAWAQFGVALAQTGQPRAALAHLDRALVLAPDHELARQGRALARQNLHDIPGAMEDYAAALARNPRLHAARSAWLLCQQYLDAVPEADRVAGRAAFAAAVGPVPARAFAPREASVRRRRLAFLSPDLRAHSVAYFLEPLLRHLPADDWEILLYHDHARVDDTSRRLQALASTWRHFAGLPDNVVEAQILQDAPDLLIDLAGHTGGNRLPLLARRLAPVQLAYLGYPDATGIPAIDARVSDALADPPGSTGTEPVRRLAGTAWCYAPPADAPLPAPSPVQATGRITFGSCNNFSKVSAATLALWAQLLQAAPGARLVLKSAGLEEAALREKTWDEFGRLGVADARDRIEFFARTPDVGSHLEFYARLDVALDTFPYQGTTTTCEALWMGRPVVALAGDRPASRVAASLLAAVGHAEWVTPTPEAYVRTALAVAADVRATPDLPGQLRAQLRGSPLLDASRHARDFAAMLRAAWAESVAPA